MSEERTSRKKAQAALLIPVSIGLICCAVGSRGIPSPGDLLFCTAAAAILSLLSETVPFPLLFLCFLPAVPFAFAATGSFLPLWRLPVILFLFPAVFFPAKGKTSLHRACALSAFLLFLYAGGFFLSAVFRAGGSFSSEAVKKAFPGQAEAVREAILSIRSLHGGSAYSVFSENDAEFYLNSLISVLPALAGGCSLILSFLASKAVYLLSGPLDLRREEAEIAFSSRMNPFSAGLFILSLLLLLFSLPDLIFMTAANLMLLFLPGCWLEAFRLLRFLWEKERFRLAALFLTVLFFALIPKKLPLDLLLFGLTGSLSVMTGVILRHWMPKKGS